MNGKLVFGRYDYAAFLTFASYAMCSVIIPMCLVPLAAELRFPLQEGGMGMGGALQMGRSIPMTVMLILCGLIGAKLGNRVSLGFALLTMALGIFLSALAPEYRFLIPAITIAGFGEGVIEGLATPFTNELHDEDPGRYLNFTHSFWSVGVLTAVLCGGALLYFGVSWRIITGGCAIAALIPAAMLLIRGKDVRKNRNTETPPDAKEIIRASAALFRTPRFLLYFAAIFLAGGGEYCLTFWTASFVQLEFGGTAWEAGICTGAFALGMIVSRMAAGWFVADRNMGKLIFLCGIGAAAVSIFFPFIHSLPILFLLVFLSGVGTGPFWPCIQSLCVRRVEGNATMIFIILSASGVPGCGFFSMLMGIAGDMAGLQKSFFMVPVCFLSISLLILADMLILKRKRIMQKRLFENGKAE